MTTEERAFEQWQLINQLEDHACAKLSQPHHLGQEEACTVDAGQDFLNHHAEIGHGNSMEPAY